MDRAGVGRDEKNGIRKEVCLEVNLGVVLVDTVIGTSCKEQMPQHCQDVAVVGLS